MVIHMVILFITYPPNILGSYIKYFINLELTITHLQNIPMPLLSKFLVSNLAIYPFIIFRSFTKNPNILDRPYPHFLFKSFEFKSNEFEFKSFNHGLFLFSRNKHIFVSPGKLSACPTSSPNLPFFSFLSLFCFYFL